MVKIEADVSEGRRREDDLSIQLGGIGNLDNRDERSINSYVDIRRREKRSELSLDICRIVPYLL